MTNRIFSLFIAGLLLIASGWVAFNRQSPFYPNMVMDAAENLSVSFLLNGQNNSADCKATIANLASVMLAKCPSCRIKQLQCLEQLSAQQEHQLSSAPLSIPSGRMANKGVALYISQDPALALSACQESERQAPKSANGSKLLKCFPADTPRVIASDKETLDLTFELSHLASWQAGAALMMAGAAAFLLLTAWRTTPDGSPTIPHRALQRLAGLPRRMKQLVIVVSDVFLLLISLLIAFAQRYDSFVLPRDQTLWLFAMVPLLAIPVFIRMGLYREITRYLGIHAIATTFKSVLIYIALLSLAVFLIDLKIPRPVLVTHGILTLFFIGATRLFARHLFNKLQLRDHASTDNRRNALIYGAGSAGVQLASALEFSRQLRPVAFIDDDPALHDQLINGLKVHRPEALPELLTRYGASEILLAMPSTTRARRNEIMRLIERLPVSVRTLPGMDELAGGTVKVEDLRELDIEDLLGRDPVPADAALLQKNIKGKAILVTGAGGSIGAELCRQILRQQPKCLVLFERNEFALYSIEQELLAKQSPLGQQHAILFPILGSITDQGRLERTLKRFNIETVFHAAAYKHVPMVEKNPGQGVRNNIIGTWHTAQAALACGVASFVLISTDKAVRPTNTMGSTKRFAEMILQALAASNPDKTRFTMVRFGNVLGSSGSVVPLFREQIRNGGPVTVTDPRIIRYFMTIPEAAQLVIQAGAMGQDGDVFVLDMGEPVKILDLAHRMIHLSGLTIKDENNPDGDIEIAFTGLRPGEKMYEELLIGDNVVETTHPRIMRANEESLPLESIKEFIGRFDDLHKRNATDDLRAALMESVKGFAPQCGNEDLLTIPG